MKLTKHFTNPSIDNFYIKQKRQSTYFEAIQLRNVRSGPVAGNQTHYLLFKHAGCLVPKNYQLWSGEKNLIMH